MTRDDLLFALQHQNVAAFLRLIREGESSQKKSAYSVLYGGSQFDSFADHPRIRFYEKADEFIRNGKKDYTTAAGAYQITESTWNPLAKKYALPDFSSLSQDLAAVALIAEKKALDPLYAGDVVEAINRCSKTWASLPGSAYGQPTQKLEKALKVYAAFGGTLATSSPSPSPIPQEVKPVAPIVAFIPSILSALASVLPALKDLGFGSGSEVANRNLSAGVLVAQKLVEVTKSVNLQEAAEKIQNDPAVQEAAKAVVQEIVYSLSEMGGGIEAARKAAQSSDQPPLQKQGAFWVSAVLILMPFMLLTDAFFVHPDTYDGNLRTQIVTAVLLIISIVGSFWLGTSFTSAKKDSVIAGLSK